MKIKILVVLCLLVTTNYSDFLPSPSAAASSNKANQPNHIFLPIISNSAGTSSPVRRVNAPYFPGSIAFGQMAIFWLGQVTPNQNYTDVRVGYNNSELYVSTETIDQRLWYNITSSLNTLSAWDSITVYLNLDGNTGRAPTANSYRFDVQLNWFEPRSGYQTVYQGNGASWETTNTSFTSTTGWRSANGPNDILDDKGWVANIHIPFTSLGLSGPPSPQTKWGLAIVAHNRNDATGTVIPDTTWPENVSSMNPASWGQLSFGLPTYTPPPATPRSTVTIRNKLNGVVVKDGNVGGYTVCGGNRDYWTQWGSTPWSFYNSALTDFAIQNESDVSDYPCFAKYYVTFPLDTLPTGKVIISSTLTLHQFGNSTTPNQSSLIQVMTVNEDWNQATLTWNTAPLALENVSQSWVDPIPPGCGTSIPWPCFSRTWDLARAVAQAYAQAKPLRLVFYSADDGYNSGKYFTASNAGDWNASGRPTLDVLWGDP